MIVDELKIYIYIKIIKLTCTHTYRLIHIHNLHTYILPLIQVQDYEDI